MPWTHKYLEVLRALDLNMAEDMRATQVLHKLVKGEDTDKLAKLMQGRAAIIYGCGPSLENDLNKIWEAGLHRKCVNVAVDGAVKALLSYKIIPHVNVTDLDGDLNAILKANHYGCMTVVHAHAGNIKRILAVTPKFTGVVYGTTQSEPTGKVHNFGGFTDGDRALYLVEHFKPKFIVLAGMDFGSVIGVHSGVYDPVKKPRGLRVGKALIEELAAHTKTRILNITSSGENIRNTRNITIDKLKNLL